MPFNEITQSCWDFTVRGTEWFPSLGYILTHKFGGFEICGYAYS